MTMYPKLYLEFGKADNGWLPTIFSYGDFELNIEISDVPIDPMVQLCDALIQINKGIKCPERILWHLEPFCYYLQLELNDHEYKVTILESDNFDSQTRIIQDIIGDFDSIILPLYRGLKKFTSQSFGHPHWEEIANDRIAELSTLIKEKRT